MFGLVIKDGPLAAGALRLVRGRTLSVGSGAGCHLVLAAEGVHQRHVEVTWSEEGFFVVALGPPAGTLLDGEHLVGRRPMRVGAHLQLGAVLLQLQELDEGALIHEPRLDQAPLLALSDAATIVAGGGLLADRSGRTQVQTGPAHAGPAAERIAVAAELTRRLGEEPFRGSGARFLLQRGEVVEHLAAGRLTIGRAQTNDLVVADPAVSAAQAVLEERGGELLLRDLGSANGTYLNGQRVVRRRVESGDVVALGRQRLTLVIAPGGVGLDLRPAPPLPRDTTAPRGLGEAPDAEAGGKRKRKKAELEWTPSSDLDRGVMRGRAAFLAFALALGAGLALLADGASSLLTGRPLSAPHEGARFDALARGGGGCQVCHEVRGASSDARCRRCHPETAREGHRALAIGCARCHPEHRGVGFRSTPAAQASCAGCHPAPHFGLSRGEPRAATALPEGALPFPLDLHVRHADRGVGCPTCHGAEATLVARTVAARPRAPAEPEPPTLGRGCAACHAPVSPRADACAECHSEHQAPPLLSAWEAGAEPPSTAARDGVLLALMVSCAALLLALVLPRRRRARV